MAMVAVVGSLTIDLMVRAGGWPDRGETIVGRDVQQVTGGKGAMQALAAAAAGAQVRMIGRVGADPFGRKIIEDLARQGVDTHWVTEDSGSCTGVSVILVDDSLRQNRLLVVHGANERLSPAEIEAASASGVWAGVRVCLLQSAIPLETVMAAAQSARRAGAVVVLDPDHPLSLPGPLLDLVDLCVLNAGELAALTGRTVASVLDARLAACALLTRGVRAVVVRLGATGALLVDGNHAQHFPAQTGAVVEVAGGSDAFTGSVVAALAENQPLEAAVARARIANALACTRGGVPSAIPCRREIDGARAPR